MRIRWMALAVALAACSSAGASADTNETITVGGVQRTYVLHVPPAGNGALSLVLAFHGAYGSGKQLARTLNSDQVANDAPLDTLADQYHMVVAYPDGVDHHWNDGRSSTSGYGDDVAFISQLIDQLEAQYGVDPKRVYATGISNGGMFVNRLGCELSNKIAAIAPVSGLMPQDMVPHCVPAQHVAVMFLHGTADSFVPAQGGYITKGKGGAVLSDQQSLAFWSRGCGGQAQQQDLSGYHVFSQFRQRHLVPATVHIYSNASCGTELVEMEDAGHMWPGSYGNAGAWFGTGKVSDFPANAAIIEFFLNHPKP